MNNFLHFWSAWLKGPHRVGAVAPSSPILSQAMLNAIEDDGEGMIVELGAGTGPITKRLSRQFPAERLLIIERDANMARHLREQFPELTVLTADARHILTHLKSRPCCAVVSALPLLSLPAHDRQDIIATIAEAIGHNGQLVQFTYGFGSPIPKLEAQQQKLYAHRERFILRNLPPATVWKYRVAKQA
ncbi:MAG: methyltransferase domain-containing protein [Xanthomonadales bacterium]|jgi:phosphatidylethanolamine/phosphatidyl-N-methylethanolamine N-methyltransferase|nr:methyltransferase domain-containing protein [Xanthomonadales bacterium]